MRTFTTSMTTLASALALAVLTAACDDLPTIPMTPTPDHTSRYTVTKDQQGRLVRFDPVTGDVMGLHDEKKVTARRSSKGPVARQTAVPAVVDAPAPPVAVQARRITAVSAAVLPLESTATRIKFDQLCSQSEARVAVTLVDTGVYARPSIGTRMVGRVVSGTLATIAGGTDDWRRVSLESPKGPLAGFVHCSTLRPLAHGPSE